VGWQAHDNESSALASDLMVDICQRENIEKDQVVLHSDSNNVLALFLSANHSLMVHA
jgi:phosphoserine phosphatase